MIAPALLLSAGSGDEVPESEPPRVAIVLVVPLQEPESFPYVEYERPEDLAVQVRSISYDTEEEEDEPEVASVSSESDSIELPSIFEDIIWCESRGNPQGLNPVSSASGLFQFIDGTWEYVWEGYIGEAPPTERAYQASVEDQRKAALALYENEGTVPWNASKGCWG